MKSWTLIIAMLLVTILFSAGNVMAGDDKIAESIVLKGGTRGLVTFPHNLHQDGDCQPCHELFPKESQIVEKMKTAGKLKKKEVMNMCRKCHKDLAKTGQKTGPTRCGDCHKK